MRFKLFFISFMMGICATAQILDKKIFLLDSLDRKKINDSDFETIKEKTKNYAEAKSDTTRLLTIEHLVEGCYDEKIWMRYNAFMIKLAREKQKNAKGREFELLKGFEALGLNNIGYYFYNYTSRFDSAEYYYKVAMKMNEEIENYDAMVVSYSNLGNVYQNNGELLKAMEYGQKALALENKAINKTGVVSALNNLANIYLTLNDTIKAIIHLKRCLVYAQRMNNDDLRAHIYHNLGVVSKNRDYDRALIWVQKSLALRKQLGDKKGTAQCLIALAGFANEKKDAKLSQQYLDEAKPLIDELGNPLLFGSYYRTSSIRETFLKNYDKAREYLIKSIEEYKRVNAVNDILSAIYDNLELFDGDQFKMQRLELIETYFKYNKVQNKAATQQEASRQQYETQMKVKETEFKADQEIKDEKRRSEEHHQRYLTITVSVILLLTLIFCYFIFKALKENREKTRVIDKQKHLVEEKQKEIIDSINYSKRIQNSFIPSDTEFNETFPHSFVIYHPKDIVSGDFYWILDPKHHPTIKKKLKAIAVADCTGHGVPGAMLSMLGASILNQAILEQSVQSPADILNFLNAELKKNLRSKNNEIIRDGMDISCCLIETDTLKMYFSGANNPCWILRNGAITELKADKQAVTAALEEHPKPFNQTEFQLQKGDMLFLFTDGFADQFGGPRGKKFMYSRMEKLLVNSTAMQPNDQKEMLFKEFSEWKGSLDQVDDVCLIGIRI